MLKFKYLLLMFFCIGCGSSNNPEKCSLETPGSTFKNVGMGKPVFRYYFKNKCNFKDKEIKISLNIFSNPINASVIKINIYEEKLIKIPLFRGGINYQTKQTAIEKEEFFVDIVSENGEKPRYLTLDLRP
jgi:hypothetical protein